MNQTQYFNNANNNQFQIKNAAEPNDITELKNMIKNLMEQISTMLIMLTTIVRKMK